MRCKWCMVCERREASACLIMLSAKQGSHWYHFHNVFGMMRAGIDPIPILTYRTRSGRSTTWAIAMEEILLRLFLSSDKDAEIIEA